MRIAVLATAVSSAVVGLALADPAAAAMKTPMNIAPQELSGALRVLASDRRLQILYTTQTVADQHTGGAVGELTVDEALTRLLSGTGLVFRYVDENTIAIMSRDDGATPLSSAVSSSSSAKIDLEEIVVTGTNIRGQQQVGSELIVIDRRDIDESGYVSAQDVLRALPQVFGGGASDDTRVLATDRESGSNPTYASSINLRGLGSGSTLILIDGRRMAPSGGTGLFVDVSSVPLPAIERIEVLPDGASALYGSDAVGGVVNFITRKDFDGIETTGRYGGDTHGNMDEVRLTQVLGESWGSGSMFLSGEYYDRDKLPAAARDRMAGDLRRFGGGDFRTGGCRPGTITVAGRTYAIPDGQDGTDLEPTDFTAGTRNVCNQHSASNLTPGQQRITVTGRLSQEVNDRLSLYVDAAFGSREFETTSLTTATYSVPATNPFYVNPAGGTGPISVHVDLTDDFGDLRSSGRTRALNTASGGTLRLGSAWSLNAYTGYALQRDRHRLVFADSNAINQALADPDPATALNLLGSVSNTNPATLARIRDGGVTSNTLDYSVSTVNATADGPLASLPGGALKLAVGADVREEHYRGQTLSVSRSLSAPTVNRTYDRKRDVSALFAELFVPVVGSANSLPGVRRLELSLAARYEDYSDFGTAFVPRFGLTWAPFASLALRSSYSESYRAPILNDLVESFNSAVARRIANPAGGTSVVLQWTGAGNEDLTEENARSYTAGFDLRPEALGGFTLSGTYFHIEYEDRIDNAGVLTYPSALVNPNFGGAVIMNPTAEQRERVCANILQYVNNIGIAGDCRTLPIVAIVDTRVMNTALLETSGADLSATYGVPFAGGQLSLQLAGTYTLNFIRAVRDGAPEQNVVNTENDPVKVRLRSSIGWSNPQWSTKLTASYLGDYDDTTSSPRRRIGSWTTFDVYVARKLTHVGALGDMQVALSAVNVLDKEPPFYNNPLGAGYDQANADLTGRFVSVAVTKKW